METKLDTITQVEKHDEHSQTTVPLSERRSIFGPLVVWVGYAFFPSGVSHSNHKFVVNSIMHKK